jgi:hypothetical protein
LRVLPRVADMAEAVEGVARAAEARWGRCRPREEEEEAGDAGADAGGAWALLEIDEMAKNPD